MIRSILILFLLVASNPSWSVDPAAVDNILPPDDPNLALNRNVLSPEQMMLRPSKTQGPSPEAVTKLESLCLEKISTTTKDSAEIAKALEICRDRELRAHRCKMVLFTCNENKIVTEEVKLFTCDPNFYGPSVQCELSFNKGADDFNLSLSPSGKTALKYGECVPDPDPFKKASEGLESPGAQKVLRDKLNCDLPGGAVAKAKGPKRKPAPAKKSNTGTPDFVRDGVNNLGKKATGGY